MLSRTERALLFRYCFEHPVATCTVCNADYRLEELAADVFRGLSHLCPSCRVDLSESAREHLASCSLLRARLDEVEAAERLQEHSAELYKQGQVICDSAAFLSTESTALRDEAVRLRPQAPDGEK
jgi:hypothetical protein